ncbi:MAG: hypothetical protein IJM91_00605 [Lachnospiraceae bacterium]|nr:hypothetical protein [Lachnospiraceae bacterium]
MSLFGKLVDGLFQARFVEDRERDYEKEREKIRQKIKKTIKETEDKGELDSFMAEMNEKIDGLKTSIEETIKENSDIKAERISVKIDEEVAALKTELKDGFNRIEDKIHSENVKSYRNIQALVDEMDKKIAKEDDLFWRLRSIKRSISVLVWLSLGIFITVILYILYSLGVFSF